MCNLKRTLLFFAFALIVQEVTTYAEGEEGSVCVRDQIQKVLLRISPENYRILEPVDGIATIGPNISRLTRNEASILRPNWKAERQDGASLQFSIKSGVEFLEDAAKLKDKGFWIFYTPSGGEARVATGHLSLLIGDTVFNRHVDEAGAEAMRSFPAFEVGMSPYVQEMLNKKYVIAQFFEASKESLEALSRFFHDRVWNFHAKTPGYESVYVPLPESRQQNVENGENCATFALCFMTSRWQNFRPEIKTVAKEFGKIEYSEIPSRQIYLNTSNQRYRGTFLLSNLSQVELVRQWTNQVWQNDQAWGELNWKNAPVPGR